MLQSATTVTTPNSSGSHTTGVAVSGGNSGNAGHKGQAKDWRFARLPSPKLPGFQAPETQEALFKWGMRDAMYIEKFTFDAHLAGWEVRAFVAAFFAEPQVTGHLRVLGRGGGWGRMPVASSSAAGGEPKPEQGVGLEEMEHTVTSLAFFDRISEGGKRGWGGEGWARTPLPAFT
jgi:hypothetical protein